MEYPVLAIGTGSLLEEEEEEEEEGLREDLVLDDEPKVIMLALLLEELRTRGLFLRFIELELLLEGLLFTNPVHPLPRDAEDDKGSMLSVCGELLFKPPHEIKGDETAESPVEDGSTGFLIVVRWAERLVDCVIECVDICSSDSLGDATLESHWCCCCGGAFWSLRGSFCAGILGVNAVLFCLGDCLGCWDESWSR